MRACTPLPPAPYHSSSRVDPPGRAHGQQLIGVQILRAVAALMVLVHHVAEESHGLFDPGAYPARLVLVDVRSVDLFFVISGFIMLHTTWDQIGEADAVLRSQGVAHRRRDEPSLAAIEVAPE